MISSSEVRRDEPTDITRSPNLGSQVARLGSAGIAVSAMADLGRERNFMDPSKMAQN